MSFKTLQAAHPKIAKVVGRSFLFEAHEWAKYDLVSGIDVDAVVRRWSAQLDAIASEVLAEIADIERTTGGPFDEGDESWPQSAVDRDFELREAKSTLQMMVDFFGQFEAIAKAGVACTALLATPGWNEDRTALTQILQAIRRAKTYLPSNAACRAAVDLADMADAPPPATPARAGGRSRNARR